MIWIKLTKFYYESLQKEQFEWLYKFHKKSDINKTVINLPFVCACHLNRKIGACGAITVIAFIVMFLILYAPEISTIGEGIGLDYNLVH